MRESERLRDPLAVTTGVYLLHFDRAYEHAEHYLGWALDIDARIEAHRTGRGARLMSVIKNAGIGFQVARIWEGATRSDERRMKVQGGKRLCPICHPGAHNRKRLNV